MNGRGRVFAMLIMMGLLWPIGLLRAQGEIDPIVTVRNVIWSDSETPVEGAEAILIRMEHGISMSLDTVGLPPGHTFTIWWVIFNSPDNCFDGLCGLDDVFLLDANGQFSLDADGMPIGNTPAREAAVISSLRATGNISNDKGDAYFRAHLPIGDITDDVVFGPGLLDPMKAEVHLILRSHGPIIQELLTEQLFTVWGGCPDPRDRSPCDDLQIAVFEAPGP